MVSIVLTYISLEGVSSEFILRTHKAAIKYAGVILLTLTICAFYAIGYYGYVYGDARISALTYQMERGVFKGLYTAPVRGEALIHLEDEIQKVTDAQDFVLFMDQAPQAYLMTRAAHSTPTTIDILVYTRVYSGRFVEGFDFKSDFVLQEYFRVSGREPNKIIYIQNKEVLEHLSLWDDDFKFNKYVSENFTQVYANDAEHFAIIVFERIG